MGCGAPTRRAPRGRSGILFHLTHRPATKGAAIPEKSIAVLPMANSTGDPAEPGTSPTACRRNSSPPLSRLKRPQSHRAHPRPFSSKARPILARRSAKSWECLIYSKVACVKSADRVRIAVALIKSGDGASVWSETVRPRTEGHLRSAIGDCGRGGEAAQGRAARALTGRPTELTTAATPSNQNVESYNALLQGNFYHNRPYRRRYPQSDRLSTRRRSGSTGATRSTCEALGRGGAHLATSYAGSVAPREVEELIATARASAKRSLELDPNLADAHSAQGWILRDIDLNFIAAEAEFRRALELAPQDLSTTRWLLSASKWPGPGRLDEAVALMQAADCARPAAQCKPPQPLAISHSARPLRRGRGGGAQGHRTAAAGRDNYYEQLAIIEIERGKSAAASF